MAKVVVERSANKVPSVRRRNVAPGSVFILVKRDGTKGKKFYGALGMNGKAYSVNLENGALASSGNADKTVAVVGHFNIKRTDYAPAKQVETTRGAVKSGQLFRSKTGENTYLALGTLNDGRFCSINMAHPFNEDYAVGKKANNPVVVVGEAEFAATISQ